MHGLFCGFLGMMIFCNIRFAKMCMPGTGGRPDNRKKPVESLKEMGWMGALIWFLFVGIAVIVMDRETFFS